MCSRTCQDLSRKGKVFVSRWWGQLGYVNSTATDCGCPQRPNKHETAVATQPQKDLESHRQDIMSIWHRTQPKLAICFRHLSLVGWQFFRFTQQRPISAGVTLQNMFAQFSLNTRQMEKITQCVQVMTHRSFKVPSCAGWFTVCFLFDVIFFAPDIYGMIVWIDISKSLCKCSAVKQTKNQQGVAFFSIVLCQIERALKWFFSLCGEAFVHAWQKPKPRQNCKRKT